MSRRRLAVLGCLLLAAAGAGADAGAREWTVAPADAEELRSALSRAAPGDLVRLPPGVYPGSFVVDRPLRLQGLGGAVLDGGGEGTVLTVKAPGTRVEGLTIRGSGASLDQESSGILVLAPEVEIVGNRLEDVLFGVYLRQAGGSLVAANQISGKSLALPRRGDAIRVWESDGTRIVENLVERGRDVVLWYSRDLEVLGNRVVEGRYGLHFMYCDDATIDGNLLLDNSVGAFLMYSRRLRMRRNTVAGNHGPSGYGVGLKDMDDALVEGNLLTGNRVGVFLDNSPRESGSVTRVEGNRISGNDIGVLLLPNVRRARFHGNGMEHNQEQMALAGGGGDPEANSWRENYWSDYAGYDADGDGRGELSYRADRLFEKLADRHSSLRFFLYSPVTDALDFAARAFPAVRPRPKLEDPAPRMQAVSLAAVPPLPGGDALGMSLAAVALLLLAGALVAAPLTRRRPAPQQPPVESPSPGEDLVEVEGLTVRLGDTLALEGVSFSVRRGEAVALWGANGAGKTTTLRALLGIVPAEGGVRVAGTDPRERGKEARRRIGFVPQDVGLEGELEVERTLELFAALRGVGPERVEELLEMLALEAHAGKLVKQLSGGLKQRLALAVALLADPPILLLDEPAANLDPAARGAFMALLRKLKENRTLIFTSHRRDEVVALADRVLMLEDGRLEGELRPEELTRAAGGPVELWLLLDREDRAPAEELLAGAGFRPRRAGAYLRLRVPAEEKMAPIDLLYEASFELRDLLLESGGEADGNG